MFYFWIAYLDDFCENQEWVKAGLPDDFDWPADDRHYQYIAEGVHLYDSGKKGRRIDGVPKTWRRMYFLYCEAGYGLDYLEARDRENNLFTAEWDLDRAEEKIFGKLRPEERGTPSCDYRSLEARIQSHIATVEKMEPIKFNPSPTGRLR